MYTIEEGKKKRQRHTFKGWRSKVLKEITTICKSFGLANSAATWWKGKHSLMFAQMKLGEDDKI